MLVEGRSIGARQGPALRTAGTGFTCDRRPRVLTLSMIPRSPQYYREIVAFTQRRTSSFELWENPQQLSSNLRKHPPFSPKAILQELEIPIDRNFAIFYALSLEL